MTYQSLINKHIEELNTKGITSHIETLGLMYDIANECDFEVDSHSNNLGNFLIKL